MFDFTNPNVSVDDWIESSDTIRDVGKSKATLVLQKTQKFQRAVFFTLLNPQPNGAAFAGVRVQTNWDLSSYDSLKIRCRGQGQNKGYKIVLSHKNQPKDGVNYEQTFDATMSSETFSDVILPLNAFEPYKWGKKVDNYEPLDRSSLSSFGFQIYGGVYSPIKQSGVSALEIENIEAYKED